MRAMYLEDEMGTKYWWTTYASVIMDEVTHWMRIVKPKLIKNEGLDH